MGMIINDWYIDNIKYSRLVCEENCWANGKVGVFKDFDNNYQLRFIEFQGKYRMGHACSEADRFLPVLAQGFVAWLIKKWGTDTFSIYSEYLQTQLKQYKTDHKTDPDVFKRDLDREFYNHFKAQEERWVKQSEAIFDFISETEVNKIKEYICSYFDYVEDVCNPTKAAINISDEEQKGLQQKRKIDSDKLKEFFIPQFKGMGNGPINHFETLISDLEIDRSAKEFAQIAFMIFESDKLNNRKPRTFKKWYGLFCQFIGSESKTYEPKDLRDPKPNLKKLFGYLY